MFRIFFVYLCMLLIYPYRYHSPHRRYYVSNDKYNNRISIDITIQMFYPTPTSEKPLCDIIITRTIICPFHSPYCYPQPICCILFHPFLPRYKWSSSAWHTCCSTSIYSLCHFFFLLFFSLYHVNQFLLSHCTVFCCWSISHSTALICSFISKSIYSGASLSSFQIKHFHSSHI